MYYPYKISSWPSAKSTKAAHRTDHIIRGFYDLVDLFKSIEPTENKIDQTIITRCWQDSRDRNNTESKPPYLVTLDYDSVDETEIDIEKKLIDAGLSYVLFGTWSHKTIETPQKKNRGKNCFKVVLEIVASSKEELHNLTMSLAHTVGKTDITRVDDFSSGIFIGGCHPDFLVYAFCVSHESDVPLALQKGVLLERFKTLEPEVTKKKDPLDDFENWDRTVGQKYTPERISKALAAIKYSEVEGFSKMSVWVAIGYALHSTGNNDFFELWDDWCLENCAEEGVYNREENENFWAKQTVPDDDKKLCTLSTLWHLEKLFKAKQDTSAIRQTTWSFFSDMAKETPEKVKFLIEGLLVENSIGFMVGTGGVGKSSLCLEVAKAIGSGQNLFGDERYPTLQKTVAIINKEDSYLKIHNQIHNLVELDCERMIRGAKQDFAEFEESNQIGLTEADKLKAQAMWENVARPQWAQSNIRLTNNDGEDMEALGAVISSLKSLKEQLKENNRPDLGLVIIDPLNLWHGGDQNSQRDMGFIFSAFQQVQRELDTAVLIVHHMNKSNGFSGSHTIRDSGRFMWYLKPTLIGSDLSDKYIDFYVEKNNDAKSNYTALQFIRTEKGLLDTAVIPVSQEKK